MPQPAAPPPAPAERAAPLPADPATAYRRMEDGSVAAHVRALRQTANFWLFHHVPKTAGSSMAAELHELLAPYRNIHGDPADRTAPQLDRLAQATDAFLAAHRERPFRAASGHLRAPHLRTILDAIPNCRMFTILRDPVARVISEYRYMCTPRHPTHAAHIRRYPTLESYVDDTITANRMALYLAPRRPAAAEPVIAHVKASYTFVGFLEDYELSFRYLTLLMFAPVPPRNRRINAGEPATNGEAPPADLAALIRERNAIDVALYEALRAVHDARRAEMIDAVEAATRC